MKKRIPNWEGAWLEEAIKGRGLTPSTLSELLDGNPTKDAIYRFQSNRDCPSWETLGRLADYLRFPTTYFLRPVRERCSSTVFWRCLNSSSKLARMRSEIKSYWVEDVIRESLCYIEFPKLQLPVLNVKSAESLEDNVIEAFADALRKEWGLGLGPISNLVWLLEAKGCITARMALDHAKLDAFTIRSECCGRPIIILNADKQLACRSRFDLAHELGHELLHRAVVKDPNDKQQKKLLEHQANKFASVFLMPTESISREFFIPSLDAFCATKKRWGVSIKAILYRFKDMSFFSEKQYQNLMINYSRRKWNSGEPLDDSWEIERPFVLAEALKVLADTDPNAWSDFKNSVSLLDRDLVEITGLPELLYSTGTMPEAKIIDLQ